MPEKSVRLQRIDCRRYSGQFEYLVAYDCSSGCRGRYTVLVTNAEDPVTIGRELPLADVRLLIAKYEKEARKLDYYGDRADVLAVVHALSRRQTGQA